MKMFRVVIALCMVVGLTSGAFGAEVKRTAKIVDLDGSADVKLSGGETRAAEIGMILNEGDALNTKAGAWAVVSLEGAEKATVEVEQNSQVMISELVEDQESGVQKTLLDLAIGKILIKAEKLRQEKSKFEVKTPTSVVGVRGTTFEVEVEGLE